MIPNLDAANTGGLSSIDQPPAVYWFPLFVPAGSRLSANAQASTASDTVVVGVFLFGKPTMPVWAGRKVTAYGADTANSRGTSFTPGASSYGSAAQLSASIGDPIRAMQIAYSGLESTALATDRYLMRVGVGSGPTWVVSDLPLGESNREFTNQNVANGILGQMAFAVPSGVSLHVAGLGNTSARSAIVYGVS
jgi:hypothetical protein